MLSGSQGGIACEALPLTGAAAIFGGRGFRRGSRARILRGDGARERVQLLESSRSIDAIHNI